MGKEGKSMDLDISLNDKKKKKGLQNRKKGMFSEQKENPVTAIVSVIIVIAALLALLILIFLSFQSGGKSGILAGGIGMLMLLAVIGGFIAGIASFRQKEIRWKYPLIGTIGNGILILIYGIIYLSGTGFF